MLIYAHRGSSRNHPENTLEAFSAALSEGADGIETDLRLTADSRVVLCHDPVFCGLKVARTTLDELRGAGLRRGKEIATLRQLLDVAAGKAMLNLEIKDPAVVPRLAPFANEIGECLFTSFRTEAWTGVRERWPGFRAGPVFDAWGEAEAETVARLRPDAVSLKASLWSREALALCRKAGADLLLWVVNDPVEAVEFEREGLPGIFTDAPGEIVAALREERADG